MDFGQHLLGWRKNRKFTQADLAKLAFLPRPFVSRLEHNHIDPSLSVLRRLSQALGISLGTLLEKQPPRRRLTTKEMRDLAEGALRPSKAPDAIRKEAFQLAQGFRTKQMAFGLGRHRYKAVKAPKKIPHTLNRFRAEIGEEQWNALLEQIQKKATLGA